MYSKEELSSKKYGDLLKILKKLGGKGGRQKTKKVIDQILEAQESTNQKDEHQSVGDSFAHAVGDAVSYEKEALMAKKSETDKTSNYADSVAVSPRRRVTRSNTFTLDEVDHQDDARGSALAVPVHSRSSTFVLEKSLHTSPTEDSGDKDESLTRSNNTFVVDNSSDRKSKLLQVPQLAEDTCEKMDLSCSEVQTAADIEHLEKIGSNPSSPLGDNIYSALKNRKTTRRSLRGQLLDYKVSSVGRRSILAELSAKSSSPSNQSTDLQEESATIVSDTKAKEKVPSAIPRSVVPENKNDKATTAIPRYVAFARAIKMPNFTRIHENAFKKMEAIDDYVDRKHTRTKTYHFSPSSAVMDKNNKGPTNLEESVKKVEKTKDFRASTKTPKRPSSSASVSQRKSLRKSRTPPNKPSALPRLVKENVPPKATPGNVWNKSQVNADSPGSLLRRKTYVPSVSKPQFRIKKTEVVRKSYEKRPRELQRPSRKDAYKQPKLKSRDEVRASGKAFIKGVRTNRRFELQMANRGIHI